MFEYKFVKVELHWGSLAQNQLKTTKKLFKNMLEMAGGSYRLLPLRLAVLDNLNISTSYLKRKYHYNKRASFSACSLLMTTVFPPIGIGFAKYLIRSIIRAAFISSASPRCVYVKWCSSCLKSN